MKASLYILALTNKPYSTNGGSTISSHNQPSPNIGPRNGTILPTPQSIGHPLLWPLIPFPHPNNVESPNTRPVTLDAVPNSYNGTTKTMTYVQCAATLKTTTTFSFAHIFVHNSCGTSRSPTWNWPQIHTHRPQPHTPSHHRSPIMALSNRPPNTTTSTSSHSTANHWLVRIPSHTNFYQLEKIPRNILPLHKS